MKPSDGWLFLIVIKVSLGRAELPTRLSGSELLDGIHQGFQGSIGIFHREHPFFTIIKCNHQFPKGLPEFPDLVDNDVALAQVFVVIFKHAFHKVFLAGFRLDQ